MAEVNAELHRRDPSGALVPWRLNADGTDPVADAVARERLQAIIDALSGTLAVGGTVTLDAAALAALESVTATIAPGGVVDLPPATIDALRAVTATLAPGGTVDLPSVTIAALRDVTAALAAGSVVGLDAATLAALESVTATISGLVRIDDATPVRVTVTNTEPITGVVELGPATRADLNEVAVNNLPTVQSVTRPDGVAVAGETTLAAIRDLLANEDFASQTTLEQVRALLAAEDFAAEATLAAIRDTIYRRTDPLPTGTNLIGNVGSIAGTKVGQGKFFIASTGRMSLTVAGNLRATLRNPAGSGKNMIVVALTSFSTSVGWASLYLNPTAGLPATPVRPRTNMILGGGLPPIGEVRADTDTTVPLSGGLDTGITIGIPNNKERLISLPPAILAPGVTLGVNVPFAGASEASMALYWYEE